MPVYDIDCPLCGPTTTVRGMNDYQKVDGITHRVCGCGQVSKQLFITPPNGIVDAPADSQPFQVAGIEGTFTSHRQLEAFCKATDKDITHTGDAGFKKKRLKARKEAEDLASEMGYSSLGAYKEKLRDPYHVAESTNQAREKRGVARD